MVHDRLRVADEVWIVTALLHRRYPERDDFRAAEIVATAKSEQAAGPGPLRAGVRPHVYLHCVANKPPNSARYRMLVETSRGWRRLFRAGDPSHPARRGGRDLPRPADVPERYRGLMAWYQREYVSQREGCATDPILALRGLGKEIWLNEDADAYVARLRKAW